MKNPGAVYDPASGVARHVRAPHALACAFMLLTSIGADIPSAARAADVPLLLQLPQHWRDDQGRDVSLESFRGRPVVFTMAYASCRRVCPMTLSHMKRLQTDMDARGEAAEFVIVGYDAEIDDPKAWHHYRNSRDLMRENWHFLTGDATSTKELARRLGFQFWKYDRHVMHGYRLVMLDRDGRMAAEYGSEG